MVEDQGFYLTVGAIGWEQGRWLKEFYPQDLPHAWRLSYYANEFSIVLVPDSCWFKAELPDARQWLDDVPDHFRFHIHVTQRLLESVHWLDIVDLWEELKPNLGGWVLQLPEQLNEPVNERLKVMQTILPAVTVDTPSVATEACWCRDQSAEYGASGVVVFTERPDRRQLRMLIEDFIEHSSGASRMLFFDAPYGAVADARTIIRLLGYYSQDT